MGVQGWRRKEEKLSSKLIEIELTEVELLQDWKFWHSAPITIRSILGLYKLSHPYSTPDDLVVLHNIYFSYTVHDTKRNEQT